MHCIDTIEEGKQNRVMSRKVKSIFPGENSCFGGCRDKIYNPK